MSTKTVLLTGANRGLGRGLLERYLNLPNHTIIAAVRNPSHPTSQSLQSLPKASGTSLIIVKYDASTEEDATAAVQELQKHSITKLDIVVANAAIARIFPLVKDLKIDDVKEHMEPNVYGVVRLYQATRNLLRNAEKEPSFALIGSMAGVLADQPPVPNSAYGPSKNAAMWYAVRINAEDEWLNAFVIDPGWVATDMGDAGAHLLGMEHAPTTVVDSCDGMIKVLENTNKAKHGAKLVHYSGRVSDWRTIEWNNM